MSTQIFPAYLFLGEENFLKEEEIKKLKKHILASDTEGFNYNLYYAQDKNFDIKGMLDALNTTPFLSDRRLVVLKDADLMQESEKESVILYLKNPQKTSVFIIDGSNSKSQFFSNASKFTKTVYFWKVKGPDLDAWILKRAGHFKKSIAKDAIYAIRENLPNDLTIISSSIDSLSLYIGGRSTITKKDVETVIGPSLSHTAFELIDAVRQKDAKKSLDIFNRLKKDKKKETELLGMIGWHIRMSLRVKELLNMKSKADICKGLKLSPYVFDNVSKYALQVKKGHILSLLKETLQADLAIKTGVNPGIVIEKLLIKMCG